MKEIKLCNSSEFALVDDEDYDLLAQARWRITHQGYAQTLTVHCQEFGIRNLLMHRHLMNNPKNMVVDHINHNKLDNRKSNLRICTFAQNSSNQPRKSNKRIRYNEATGKYHIRFSRQYGDKCFSMDRGPYDTEEIAIKEWNKLAIEHRGEYANLIKNI